MENREFITNMKEIINGRIGDDKVYKIFEKCMMNTLDTTVKFTKDYNTFIITGDIPAMWLRDSVCQVRPYLPFAKENEELKILFEGLIRKHYQLIKIDPYANAFNESENGRGHQSDLTDMSPAVWERKYEIDSLCFSLQLAYLYYKETGVKTHLNDEFAEVANIVIDLWRVEQYHEEKSKYRFERRDCVELDTLVRNGLGSETKYTGMTWSGFRPSDDACTYGYLVPSNMFAVVVLEYVAEISRDILNDNELEVKAIKLRDEIEKGISEYAITEDKSFGKIYAYEVDGMGNCLTIDDANMPSLLSMPMLGYNKNKEVYSNTRKLLLSKDNKYYKEGKYARGIGSPHTPEGYIWHIAMAVQGLTSDDESEKLEIIKMMKNTDADTLFMHESFNPDNPSEYTREWFSWANAMFCELVMDYCGIKIKG